MASNEATIPCNSSRPMPQYHNRDSLLSLIGSSIQSSASPPPALSFPFSASTASRSHSCQSVLEILDAVELKGKELKREDSYEIDDLFKLTGVDLPSHGPKQ
ncbi:unnamed protein product [Cylindrotheca closterium]|uniref:Uncharacterized protein n=1 Tax=Cylindrotheca closterium TaxID=2856 RepID=A0AAD2JJJ5_9STRA|nr:unnamed protein product [Cylindrotheca closterium]